MKSASAVRGGLSGTVHGAFADQAKVTPDQTAILERAGATTYRQLDDRASAIATALTARGIGPGQIVMIALDRSVDMIASFLSVMRVGAAYCSMDLQDPPARHAIMLRDAKPRVLITAHRLQSVVAGHGIPLLCVEDIPASEVDASETAPADTDTAATLMFTSGSTGQPKGALVPHRGILRLFFGSDYVPFGLGLRTLLHSPPHFDASTFEIWASLLHGGVCAILPGERIPTLGEFAKAIRAFDVNCLFLGPAFFNFIIDQDPSVLASVGDVVIGGEVMSVRHIRKAIESCPATRFVNGYGPTETTTFATCYKVPIDLPADVKSVPIGKPIAGTECYLLDETGQPVTAGEIGELHIGGDGVSLGYIDRPELTAQRFAPDPFSHNSSRKMFRTGDMCRLLRDGNIEFIGRADKQLKIRGHRVEPGEIESQIGAHPAVAQAAVTVRRAGENITLDGYYTLHPSAGCSPERMMEHLRQRLPLYLLPRSVQQLPRMPLSSVGTVDLAALPVPAAVPVIGETVAPSPVETQVLDIWREVLTNPATPIDGDFFTLGGTSLDAMRLCLLIEKATGIFVPISMLLANTTARTFASAMQAHDPSATENVAVQLAGAGDLAPVFFVGGDVGHPMELRLLAQKLSQNRRIYGLQLPGLDGTSNPLESVEAAAKYLLPTVRRLSGGKPVHLLGYCYGGLIAYEMACMLREDHSNVGCLLLIDAWTAASIVRKPWHRRIAARFRFHLRNLRDKVEPRVGKTKPVTILPSTPPGRLTLDRLIDQMRAVCLAAFQKYVPRKYEGPLLSIRARGDDPFDLMMSKGSGGWEQPVGSPVATCQIPGDHSTMLRVPYVTQLARVVDEKLGSCE